MKTYVGQTAYEKAELEMRMNDWKSGRGRKPVASGFQSWMKVSKSGIEGFSLNGPCGGTIRSDSTAKDPPIPVVHGAFAFKTPDTNITGRLTAMKIRGSYSSGSTKRCATTFVLTAKSAPAT